MKSKKQRFSKKAWHSKIHFTVLYCTAKHIWLKFKFRWIENEKKNYTKRLYTASLNFFFNPKLNSQHKSYALVNWRRLLYINTSRHNESFLLVWVVHYEKWFQKGKHGEAEHVNTFSAHFLKMIFWYFFQKFL